MINHNLKLLLFTVLTCQGLGARAQQSYTLQDNQTGRTYTCTSGASSDPMDPQCAGQMADFCNSNTSFSRDTCFTKSAAACGRGVQSSCVRQVYDTCSSSTSMGRNQCFDEAISACGGSAAAIQTLIKDSNIQTLKQVIQ